VGKSERGKVVDARGRATSSNGLRPRWRVPRIAGLHEDGVTGIGSCGQMHPKETTRLYNSNDNAADCGLLPTCIPPHVHFEFHRLVTFKHQFANPPQIDLAGNVVRLLRPIRSAERQLREALVSVD
jgi:hypothetical protein